VCRQPLIVAATREALGVITERAAELVLIGAAAAAEMG
jgi:hypothetical protein